MKFCLRALVIIMSFFYCYTPLSSCTSILVSKGASKKGYPMISYSCDGEFHPYLRIIKGETHKPGDVYEIKSWKGIIGKIPQVPVTYKVVGHMNEHQLAIGETTFEGRLELVNPKGYFHYYTLMMITLQRAKTAREAINVMADLVEKYGYRSSGESISIADKKEAWIFEIIGKGPGVKGANWVAVKVPDGYISATANMSRIREFPLNDPSKALYSKDIIEFATKKGYYNPKSGKAFSFSAAFNPPTEEQVRYSARRIWSIFRRVAPLAKLSPDYSSFKKGVKPYPLFIKPDKKLCVRDIIALHRDHYEGTQFDMTKDSVSGPFNAPDRWRPMKWKVGKKTYTWERPIATQQAAFVFVTESRHDIPDEIGGIYWYGIDNPYTSVFIPLYSSITKIPPSYQRGSIRKYTRDSAWWTFNFVSNYANLRYSYMIKDVKKVQKELEDYEFILSEHIDKIAGDFLKNRPDFVSEFLNRYCVDNAENVVRRWRDLGDYLVSKYNDGYIQDERHRSKEIGYPLPALKKEVKKNGKRRMIKEERKGEGEL